MKAKKQKLIVIMGPNASGKSDLAVEIAKKFNGEVVSADSRQVYRGMDIGTGKVPKDKSKMTLRGVAKSDSKNQNDNYRIMRKSNIKMEN